MVGRQPLGGRICDSQAPNDSVSRPIAAHLTVLIQTKDENARVVTIPAVSHLWEPVRFSRAMMLTWARLRGLSRKLEAGME